MIDFTVSNPADAKVVEQFLYEAGKQAQREADARIIKDQFGQEYIVASGEVLEMVEQKHEMAIRPDLVCLSTLSGLIEFINQDPDHIFHNKEKKYQIRVDDPTNIYVESPLQGYHQERLAYAKCTADVPQINLGRYMDTEEFQVMLQTCFMPTENLDLVLRLAGSVRKDQSLQKADDGVSQKITINSGVTTASDVVVKNPVELIPFRTFMEVDQPVSPFVLRFNEEGRAALFTGAGKAWVVEAKKNIVAYLKRELLGSSTSVFVMS